MSTVAVTVNNRDSKRYILIPSDIGVDFDFSQFQVPCMDAKPFLAGARTMQGGLCMQKLLLMMLP